MTSTPNEDLTGNSGFAEAYSLSTGRRQTIPRHWIGDPVLGLDFALTPGQRELDGDLGPRPRQDSTIKEIEAYADAAGVDLAGASGKDEKLAAVEAVFGPGEVQEGLLEVEPAVEALDPDADPVVAPSDVDTAPGTSPNDGDQPPAESDSAEPDTTETPGDGDKE